MKQDKDKDKKTEIPIAETSQYGTAVRILALNFGIMSTGTMTNLIQPLYPVKYKAQALVKEIIESGIMKSQDIWSSGKSWYMSPDHRLNTIADMAKNLSDTEKERILSLSKFPMQYYGNMGRDIFHNELAQALLYPGMILKPRTGTINLTDSVSFQFLFFLTVTEVGRTMYPELLRTVPVQLVEKMAEVLVRDAVYFNRISEADAVKWLVDGHVDMNPIQKNSVLQQLSIPMHVLRDDFTNLGFNEKLVPGECGYAALAIRAYLEGQYRESESLFRAGLRSGNERKTVFENVLFDFFYVCALKKSSSSLSLKTMDSLFRKKVFEKNFWYAPVTALLHCFCAETNAEYFNDLNSNSDAYPFLNRYLLFLVVDAAGYMDKSSDKIRKEYVKCIETPGYELLKRKGLVPIERQEEWEKAYNRLMVKLGYNDASKGKAAQTIKKGNCEKVVYELDMVNFSVQPVLKKSTDGVNWTKGRNIALKTFSKGIEAMNDTDRKIAAQVSYYSSYWSGQVWTLSGKNVIRNLIGCEVYDSTNPDMRIEILPLEPYIRVEKGQRGFTFKGSVVIENSSDTFELVKETPTLLRVIQFSTRQKEIMLGLKGVCFPPESKDRVNRLIDCISKDIVVHADFKTSVESGEKVKADARITILMQPSGQGVRMDFYVKPFDMAPPYVKPGTGSRVVYATRDGQPVLAERDLKLEKKNFQAVSDSLASSLSNMPNVIEELSAQTDNVQDTLSVLDTLRQIGDGVRVEWPDGCRFKIVGAADFRNLNLKVSGSGKWFELDGDVKVSEDKVLEMSLLMNALDSSVGRFVQIGEGEFIALTSQLKHQLDTLKAISQGKGSSIPVLAAPILGEMETAGSSVKENALLKRLLKSIASSEKSQCTVPPDLKAELRPYQIEGFNWMCRLSEWGTGGCLADDMGLGKTVQTLAMLLHRAQTGPALVVVPASVLGNWLRETVRFAPSLCCSVINTMGADERKEAVSQAKDHDLVLVTYGVLVSEKELFKSVTWSTMVLDEAHIIKNKDTKGSQACMEIKADFRLVLTGTPLQNHLGEIWNLFQFINPGYLGSFNHFNATFLQPIEQNGDRQRQAQLKRLVLPFMLRRTKTDVLDELPEKTEQIIQVELSDNEMALYESLRRRAEQNLEEHQAGLVQTLAEITKLRQAVLSPYLVNKNLDRESSKVNELLSIADRILDGGHKALVFSQFTSFLEIVREAFDARGLKYLYLDGSTPAVMRQTLVRQFQTGDIPFFLISLKAGGLGLNLTAADYIIHTDPWWNPAVEDQASDRAYRIGQTRPVTVYRLIASGTIEEKILSLHKNKRSLADSLLEGTDMSGKMSAAEMLELLRG